MYVQVPESTESLALRGLSPAALLEKLLAGELDADRNGAVTTDEYHLWFRRSAAANTCGHRIMMHGGRYDLRACPHRADDVAPHTADHHDVAATLCVSPLPAVLP